jgi:hypothetical protein
MGLKRGSQRTVDKSISSFVGFKIVIFLEDQNSRMKVCVDEMLYPYYFKKLRKAGRLEVNTINQVLLCAEF